MPRPLLLNEFQSFAANHSLPAPALAEDNDGQHAFVYSQDKARRYAYTLTWSPSQAHVLWVMLNPGTGETEGRRRNTFERGKKWSQSLGYGGLLFGNVFSLRSKSAKDLLKLPKLPDVLNQNALSLLSRLASEPIVAWGNHGAKADIPICLQGVLKNPKCFGYTKS